MVMRTLKRSMLRGARSFGYDIVKMRPQHEPLPVEFEEDDIALVREIFDRKFTLVSQPRLVATLKACRHAVEQGIEGDFVECGVWRGGNAILAKSVFERLGSDKKVYLFDTFTGMTEPTEVDIQQDSREPAKARYEASVEADHSSWCYASRMDVEANFHAMGLSLAGAVIVEGDVLETLSDPANLPEQISVLRLDTDWYESTLAELQVLYPRLSIGGSLLIDDYGYWQGARRAIDEYFVDTPHAPLLQMTDASGRMGVKVA